MKNTLAEKYPEEIQYILEKYPPEEKRSAVMPMLYLAQREDGYVSERDMAEIAQLLGISSTHVASIVGFYTLYYDKAEGKHRIQVCTDLPCALRGADQFLAELLEKLGIEAHGTTDDGIVTVEPVMCLAACDKAPMFQCNFHYYENYDMEQMKALIEQLRTEAVAEVANESGDD